ncbi:alanine racemase [Streptomyces sp. RS10V-4]|uniref:alanine racemase n=1 Tax=Streptomyces rhizoryzae TaxID=2932493 RepID=UPI002005D550|nr:alanine racemase [Streptomyces rhizoryzae]MCK7621644.1 alanine racemase [Streptomyces rhizoryzae]
MSHDDTLSTGAREMPELRLSLPALDHNVQLMADWCRDQGVALCPHIKTTMTRPIVERQLAAGAWGVTVATVRQGGTALGWGARRILIANEVIHRPDLALMRRWLEETPDLELYCFVDSMAGLNLARSVMDGVRSPLHVLVDVGAEGGRTGVREAATAHGLAVAAQESSGILLAGVAGYEGIRPNRRDATTVAEVDAHCRKAADLFRSLTPLFQTARPVFSMGGSAFPDRVVHALSDLTERPGAVPVVPVLRSGCYVTHDHGTYEQVSPLPGLKAALTVRAVVLSAPEPGRIVVGAGKRELPYDAGLPVLIGSRDAQGTPQPAARATAEQIYDHHLVLTGARGLKVGDVVDLGISHPCSAFDRWPDITVVDDEGRTQDVWHPQVR